jgi:hypothetical protein
MEIRKMHRWRRLPPVPGVLKEAVCKDCEAHRREREDAHGTVVRYLVEDGRIERIVTNFGFCQVRQLALGTTKIRPLSR